ncbi:MAG TPA: hypothetical protein VM491_16995 [Burkholderiaceae bacterium]|nr:hypothetical protein [Burkholderiaceae bacterium]
MAPKPKGYTLIEPFAVTAMLVVLGTFAIPRYTTNVKQARVPR